MSLAYFLIAACGMTQIIVYGKIFDKIRPKKGFLGQLSSCSMCTGFWVGVFLWSVNAYTTLFNYDYSPVTALLLGCAASGTSYVFSVLIDDNGFKIERSENYEAQKTSTTCSTM